MKPRLTSVAVSILSLSLGAPCSDLRAGEQTLLTSNQGPASAIHRSADLPPAISFSINDVLLDHDRQRGRGPGAIRLAALQASSGAVDGLLAKTPGGEVGSEPFALSTFRVPDGVLWHKWKGIEAEVAKDQALLDQCLADPATCPPHAIRFIDVIDVVASKSGRAQLQEANRAINGAVLYVNDSAQHGEADRWSTPLQTFATLQGDCEDYAIAKYVALRRSGFAREDMRVVLVRDRAVGQEHAVLVARVDGRWLILDNRNAELTEDVEASNFTPLFAINDHGVEIFAAPYASRLLSDAGAE